MLDALSAIRSIQTSAVQNQAAAALEKTPTIQPAELKELDRPAALGAGGSVAAGTSFSDVLGNMVKEVNARQAAGAEAVNGLLTGQNVSLHETMIKLEEASVSFQLMVEVRNKLLESYQELMRMQV